MTAAKIMDIISRLPGCAGQAADAVSACTQVKMENAPILLKIPKSECPDIWIRQPKHKWPNSWSIMQKPSRSSWAKSVWSSFGRTVMGKAICENPIEVWLFVQREKGVFLSVNVDDIKLAGKERNIDPMWKVLNKEVDLGEPTSFLDHEYLGCIQRQCEISKDIVDNYRNMFESRISARGTAKLPCSENLRISSWSCDMEGHAKKCVERYCELANKTTQQLYKASAPCIDDHHVKEEELKPVGELSTVCSQIVLKCPCLARIGRPDILWSVNKLARAVTKWTKSLWQTFGAFDLLHSSHMWIQAIMSRGKHSTTMYIRWALMYFRKSHVCSHKLDVQETDLGLTQFNRSRAYLSWCRLTHGWNSRSRSLGFSDWSISFLTKPTKPKITESHGETCRQQQPNMRSQIPTKHTSIPI